MDGGKEWVVFCYVEPDYYYNFWYTSINTSPWFHLTHLTPSLKIIGFDGVEQSIPAFLESYFGYKASMLGPIVAILLAFSACFIGVSVFGFSRLNFQSR